MAQEYFKPPLLIKEGVKTPVHVGKTPYLCNIGGQAQYFKEVPCGTRLLEPTCSSPKVALGNAYQVISSSTSSPEPQYGEQTRIELLADQLEYAPLWATRVTAAAFGMTLVKASEAIRIESPYAKLSHVAFEYGMFAGHQSPYLGTGNRLLGRVCTDLEHHDFPHVFASVDPHLPLVISVARYWPRQQRICLADLWLPQGQALYVPPRPKRKSPKCLDLHGNRNSALACWRSIGPASIQTQTLLQTDGGYFHWFWNDLPAIHPLLP